MKLKSLIMTVVVMFLLSSAYCQDTTMHHRNNPKNHRMDSSGNHRMDSSYNKKRNDTTSLATESARTRSAAIKPNL